jgi:hypothetical protein
MLHDQFLSPNPSALFKMKVLASIDVEIKRNNLPSALDGALVKVNSPALPPLPPPPIGR